MIEKLNRITAVTCKDHAYQYHYYDTHVVKYRNLPQKDLKLIETFSKGVTKTSPFTLGAELDEDYEIKVWRDIEDCDPDFRELMAVEKLSAHTSETIQDYEDAVGMKVSEAFRLGWNMARTTNTMLGL